MCDCKNKNDFSELINPSNCYTNPCNKKCPIDPNTCSDVTTYKQQILSCTVPLPTRLSIDKYGKESQSCLNKMMPLILTALQTGDYSGLMGQVCAGWVFRIFSQTGVLLFSSVLAPSPSDLFTLLLAKCVNTNEIVLIGYELPPVTSSVLKQNKFSPMATGTNSIGYGSTVTTTVSTSSGASTEPVVTVDSVYFSLVFPNPV